MYKGIPYTNKHVKRREEERIMGQHKLNLYHIRPVTGTIERDDRGIVINNRKKEMQKQIRYTQIERQNRILLEKIATIMGKSTNKQSIHQKANKSLNSSFRRRQHQNIEIENAKMLKRLQDKKPNYDTEKLKQDWLKQKHVIKNVANYPFILNDKRRATIHGKRSFQVTGGFQQPKKNVQLCRVRVIDGINFLITVKMNSVKLQIIGECTDKKEMKVIEIERGEAIEFLQQQCQGKIELIFDRLRYDKEQEVLFLVGIDVSLDELNQHKQISPVLIDDKEQVSPQNINQQQLKNTSQSKEKEVKAEQIQPALKQQEDSLINQKQ